MINRSQNELQVSGRYVVKERFDPLSLLRCLSIILASLVVIGLTSANVSADTTMRGDDTKSDDAERHKKLLDEAVRLGDIINARTDDPISVRQAEMASKELDKIATELELDLANTHLRSLVFAGDSKPNLRPLLERLPIPVRDTDGNITGVAPPTVLRADGYEDRVIDVNPNTGLPIYAGTYSAKDGSGGGLILLGHVGTLSTNYYDVNVAISDEEAAKMIAQASNTPATNDSADDKGSTMGGNESSGSTDQTFGDSGAGSGDGAKGAGVSGAILVDPQGGSGSGDDSKGAGVSGAILVDPQGGSGSGDDSKGAGVSGAILVDPQGGSGSGDDSKGAGVSGAILVDPHDAPPAGSNGAPVPKAEANAQQQLDEDYAAPVLEEQAPPMHDDPPKALGAPQVPRVEVEPDLGKPVPHIAQGLPDVPPAPPIEPSQALGLPVENPNIAQGLPDVALTPIEVAAAQPEPPAEAPAVFGPAPAQGSGFAAPGLMSQKELKPGWERKGNKGFIFRKDS